MNKESYKYKVKEIKFPKFEDWYKSPDAESKFEIAVGFYSIFIGEVGWTILKNKEKSVAIEFEAYIADKYYCSASNPYAEKIVRTAELIDSHDIKAIKKWYNAATEYLNKNFADYIKNTYLDIIQEDEKN